MEQQASEVARRLVVVLDTQVLRREAIVLFLQPWALANQVSLVGAVPDEVRPAVAGATRCALVLLSIGGIPFGDPTPLAWLEEIEDALPATPVVVLGDCGDPDDIIAAVEAGVRGFLPTSMDPQLALHALTFIMNGGSYFPPGALLMEGPAAAGPRHDNNGGPRRGAARGRTAGLTVEQQAILVYLRDGKPTGRLRSFSDLLTRPR